MSPRTASLVVFLSPLFVVGAGSYALADGWKNLQVLPKTISRDEMKAVMRAQSKALGVECEYCHAQPDMAKETDKKKIGRAMMRMTRELDAKYLKGFDDKVTCYTCHRGKEKPEAAPTP